MDPSCVLCAIAAHREPATFHHEGDDVVAIDPLRPMAPVHVLLFPRRHATDLPALLGGRPLGPQLA